MVGLIWASKTVAPDDHAHAKNVEYHFIHWGQEMVTEEQEEQKKETCEQFFARIEALQLQERDTPKGMKDLLPPVRNNKPNSCGVRFFSKTKHKGEGVRIDQGVPGSSYSSQIVDHVSITYTGQKVDRNGTLMPNGTTGNRTATKEETHIPLTQWSTWKTWYSK